MASSGHREAQAVDTQEPLLRLRLLTVDSLLTAGLLYFLATLPLSLTEVKQVIEKQDKHSFDEDKVLSKLAASREDQTEGRP